MGFDLDEGLLPYPRQSFPGYRLLTELFAYPAKFLFLDLKGLDRASRAGFGNRFEVIVWVNRGSETHEQGVNRDTFRLGCVPVVNLFEQTAEPIPLTQTRHEYKIVPDVTNARGTEVYSVESVTGSDPQSGTTRPYLPFYSYRHGTSRDKDQTFFVATRQPGRAVEDRGTDVVLSLIDLGFDPYAPAESTLVVRTLCTNRELPAGTPTRRGPDRLRAGGGRPARRGPLPADAEPADPAPGPPGGVLAIGLAPEPQLPLTGRLRGRARRTP